jgi:hypothetical protein
MVTPIQITNFLSMENIGMNTVTLPPQTGYVEAVFMIVLCTIVIIYCIYMWWTQPS